MAALTADMIKELRERTGVGMGKCKEALEQANGNMDLAIENLRKSGMASAVKKEGRSTNEGMITSALNGPTVAVVEVNAETDFVVKNDRFQDFLKAVAEEVAATHPANLAAFLQQPYSKDKGLTVDQYRATMVQTIGENIQIRRIEIFKKSPSKSIGVYSHLGGKILTLVEIEGSDKEEELAKAIAMHVAATAPDYLKPEEVPADILEKEKEIVRSQIQGKPANMIDKIVEGKMNSYYDQVCLTRQKYIRDDSKTIQDLVNEASKKSGKLLTLKRFIRWSVGQ